MSSLDDMLVFIKESALEILQEALGVELEANIADTSHLIVQPYTAFVKAEKPHEGYFLLSMDAPLVELVFARKNQNTESPKDTSVNSKEITSGFLTRILVEASKKFAQENQSMLLSATDYIMEYSTFPNHEGVVCKKIQLKYEETGIDIYFRSTLSEVVKVEAAARGANDPLRVMVVDDSLVTIKRIELILKELGHIPIAACNNGLSAIKKYNECNPDLVTMDISMPDMDGIEATKAICNEFKDAIIIMLTSHGQERMVMDAIRAGAKGYVLKPVVKDKLGEAIDKVVKNFF